jgi:hypothetical protein
MIERVQTTFEFAMALDYPRVTTEDFYEMVV